MNYIGHEKSVTPVLYYQNLQDILTVLEKKGDAIAHVRSSGVHCPKCITEFSDDVENASIHVHSCTTFITEVLRIVIQV